jgi:hypothetical protein
MEKAKFLLDIICLTLLNNLNFLNKYATRNELIWSDGFLLDFLQKKSLDLWIRKFLVYTGFLFSERLVFEYLIRLYSDYFVLPMTNLFYAELPNVSSVLSIMLYMYVSYFMATFLTIATLTI